ncbi:MAG: Transcriptional regulatory protein DegU [Luteibacter sp.]|uniref:response regulator transcription factor n=1 Tax=Luteibacter sp. TaxID=1886636 RepID=UPI00138366E8|nr:response regulator transcription factor [Luteibacter sp.]KAF1004773.1 MAG: Transcriptional regulatory protein DegU [Luteibacter sp.]
MIWPQETCAEGDEVLVVERQVSAQVRLRQLLQHAGYKASSVHVADGASDAMACLALRSFSLALVEVGSPHGQGCQLVAWLTQRHPDTAVIAVFVDGGDDEAVQALRAGARGCLLKERDDVELALALRSARRGGAPIDPFVAHRLLKGMNIPVTLSTEPVPVRESESSAGMLSSREIDVLRLIAQGFSNREIAELTGLSHFTVEGYTKAIYRKLAVRSRTAAVFEARSMGLLPP